MHDLVLFAKALSDPNRIRILSVLRQGEVCVCEIVDALSIPQSSLSSHLQCLRQSGVVRSSKKGTWAYYAIEDWAKPVLASLDKHFSSLSDPTLQQDEKRLYARLALRENGCCVIGHGQLIRLGETKRT